jgi:hypothetical protein
VADERSAQLCLKLFDGAGQLGQRDVAALRGAFETQRTAQNQKESNLG